MCPYAPVSPPIVTEPQATKTRKKTPMHSAVVRRTNANPLEVVIAGAILENRNQYTGAAVAGPAGSLKPVRDWLALYPYALGRGAVFAMRRL